MLYSFEMIPIVVIFKTISEILIAGNKFPIVFDRKWNLKESQKWKWEQLQKHFFK